MYPEPGHGTEDRTKGVIAASCNPQYYDTAADYADIRDAIKNSGHSCVRHTSPVYENGKIVK